MNGQAAQRLPVDLVALIASHVSGVDVIRMCAVCRVWSQLQASDLYLNMQKPALLALAEFFTETSCPPPDIDRESDPDWVLHQPVLKSRLLRCFPQSAILHVFAGAYHYHLSYEDRYYRLYITSSGQYCLQGVRSQHGLNRNRASGRRYFDHDEQLNGLIYVEKGHCSITYVLALRHFVLRLVPESPLDKEAQLGTSEPAVVGGESQSLAPRSVQFHLWPSQTEKLEESDAATRAKRDAEIAFSAWPVDLDESSMRDTTYTHESQEQYLRTEEMKLESDLGSNEVKTTARVAFDIQIPDTSLSFIRNFVVDSLKKLEDTLGITKWEKPEYIEKDEVEASKEIFDCSCVVF